ncbi:hypothetical protein [Kitasatospora sp. NBC_01302]|uniref:hypothetical protein n=1 Tax=Kitasatospora sp. NBC_01302 TaxID=2903575 RepID=UPI002E120DE5|nr:hypothetical protein OG294_35205 [Kitasatospora sp. NBC_01302]
MPEPTTPAVPRTWPRVQLADQPPGVTALSLPLLGTSWVRRGLRYWWRRGWALALFAVVPAFQVGLWRGLLEDDHRGGHLDGSAWLLVAFGVLGTFEGVRMYLFKEGIPFFRLWADPRPAVRVPYRLAVAAYLLVVAAMTPGIYLSLMIEWLHPVIPFERAARADLDAQLRA